jgi:phage shock protein A
MARKSRAATPEVSEPAEAGYRRLPTTIPDLARLLLERIEVIMATHQELIDKIDAIEAREKDTADRVQKDLDAAKKTIADLKAQIAANPAIDTDAISKRLDEVLAGLDAIDPAPSPADPS